MQMDTEEIFKWDVEKLDEALKEMSANLRTGCSKSRKAHELRQEVEKVKAKKDEDSKVSSDTNRLVLQAVEMMQQSMGEQ